jgi:hypothetical protein
MPKVSPAEVAYEERERKGRKTDISIMSLAEINHYLKDRRVTWGAIHLFLPLGLVL